MLQAKPVVFTSIQVHKFFVDRIAEHKIDSRCITEEKWDILNFSAPKYSIKGLMKAKLYFTAGIPFEKGIVVKNSIKVNLSSSQRLYSWMDPVEAIEQITVIYKKLCEVDASNKDFYKKNYKKLVSDIDELYLKIKDHLLAASVIDFFVVDNFLSGYARRFYIFEHIIKTSMNAKEFKYVMSLAKEKKIKLVFVKSYKDKIKAKYIASSIGSRIKVIDPFSYEWLSNLKVIALAIRRG